MCLTPPGIHQQRAPWRSAGCFLMQARFLPLDSWGMERNLGGGCFLPSPSRVEGPAEHSLEPLLGQAKRAALPRVLPGDPWEACTAASAVVWKGGEPLCTRGRPCLDLAVGTLVSAKSTVGTSKGRRLEEGDSGSPVQSLEEGNWLVKRIMSPFTGPPMDNNSRVLEESPFQRVMKNSSGFCARLPMNSKQRQWLGRGPLSPFPRGQGQMWAICGWGAPLSWERGCPVT